MQNPIINRFNVPREIAVPALAVGILLGLLVVGCGMTVAIFGVFFLALVRPTYKDGEMGLAWGYEELGKRWQSVFVVVMSAVISAWAWVLGPSVDLNMSWTGNCLSAAALLPFLIVLAPNNRSRYVSVLIYYLIGSWVIPDAARAFFDSKHSFAMGFAMWLGSSAILSLAWSLPYLLKRARFHSLPEWACLLGGILFVSLPPFGLIGWLSPIASAGALFPGLGTAGVILLLASWCVFALCRQCIGTLSLVFFAAVGVTSVLSNAFYTAPADPVNWFAQSTYLGPAKGGDLPTVNRQLQLIDLVREPVKGGAKVILLPEQVAGRLDNALRLVWRMAVPTLHLKANQVILVGQEIQLKNGGYMNGLVMYAGSKELGAVTARQTVPYSMWHPWEAKDHVEADWFKTNVLNLPAEGSLQPVSIIFCYEEFLPWVTLTSLSIGQSKAMLVAANAWWASPHEEQLQSYHSRAWARLYGVPVMRAVNRRL